MHRFFVEPQAIKQDSVELPAEVTHQIARVLRMRVGGWCVVLDNSGMEYTVELLTVPEGKDHGLASARIVHKKMATSEPSTRITLYQAILKGERFEWVLQKGTELGMIRFVPLLTARVISRDRSAGGRKQQRWQDIIREAAEQAERGRLPLLDQLMAFDKACAEVQDNGSLGLLACERIDGPGLKQVIAESTAVRTPREISLLIGPEGGFTPEEVDLARRHNLQVFGLGPRILRAETAGLVAASAILYELGDLGG